jgi:hypothetical protein
LLKRFEISSNNDIIITAELLSPYKLEWLLHCQTRSYRFSSSNISRFVLIWYFRQYEIKMFSYFTWKTKPRILLIQYFFSNFSSFPDISLRMWEGVSKCKKWCKSINWTWPNQNFWRICSRIQYRQWKREITRKRTNPWKIKKNQFKNIFAGINNINKLIALSSIGLIEYYLLY